MSASRPPQRQRAISSRFGARDALLGRWRLLGEQLEPRLVLSAVPFGAAESDTAEFMVGDVAVTVVLLESNGQRDPNTEDWTTSQIEDVKRKVRAGLDWWEELLDAQNSVHELNFQLDFQYADQPVSTSYEPISRASDDFVAWIDDFFAAAEVPTGGDFSDRIRQFNHTQRIAHETHWAFTIFVVNASRDSDKRFASTGSFSQSFAYPGGRFFVTTSERPASAIAHETGHMFWAMDEYAGGRHYVSRRGYYNTQNLNAFDGNPAPQTRVRSIMDSHAIAYETDAISLSAKETIGWKDSDGDGIFDVLDVPHSLVGQGWYDAVDARYHFSGASSVQTLANQNTSGSGNDMTINWLDEVQVRYDGGPWVTAHTVDAYQAELDFSLEVPEGAQNIDLRAIDLSTGVTSEIWSDTVPASNSLWQNPRNPLDVNGDTVLSPIDALLIINRLNADGAGELVERPVGPPYLDSSGDGFVSPIDALMVINQLNAASGTVNLATAETGGDDGTGGTPAGQGGGSPRPVESLPEGEWERKLAAALAAMPHLHQRVEPHGDRQYKLDSPALARIQDGTSDLANFSKFSEPRSNSVRTEAVSCGRGTHRTAMRQSIAINQSIAASEITDGNVDAAFAEDACLGRRDVHWRLLG